MTIINGTTVNPNHYYRIKNNFEGSDNCFWYWLASNAPALYSGCTNEKEATIYKGDVIIENAKIIREYKTAKLIEV